MSDERTVRSWKDPEAPRTAPGHPIGEPDLTALTGGEQEQTVFEMCTGQTACGTCGGFTFGCC
ncbi:hypothetical protein ABZW03_02255 [Kitasatospora sp. NPDC004799]|uniref:hypothetical protein n=1 Tax=Kitasatospora sp. NPDC004799 TaxID=3154460 RepID=UPI0033A43E3F